MFKRGHGTRLVQKNGDINMCTKFVKVPIIFLGTVGFSLPREGHYRSAWYYREIVVDS